MKSNFSKKVSNEKMGPGGMKCVCCGPAPGKPKRAFIRTAKRKLRAYFVKEVRNELKEL